jgi:hypothetical protein
MTLYFIDISSFYIDDLTKPVFRYLRQHHWQGKAYSKLVSDNSITINIILIVTPLNDYPINN